MKTKVARLCKVPALCHHKGRGLFYAKFCGHAVYFGSDPAIARRLYNAAAAEHVARGGSPAPPSPEEVTIVELCDLYLEDRTEYYANSPGSFRRATDFLKAFADLYGHTLAKDLTPSALKAFRTVYMDRGVTRGYINEGVGIVKRMLKWASCEGLLDVSVYERARCLEGLRKGFTTAPEGKKREPMTMEELEAVRGHLPKPVMAALEAMFWTGARPSEILGLTPSMIDRTFSPWRVVLSEHKTAHLGKSRTIFIGPRAQKAMAPYLLRPADAFMFSPKEAYAESLGKRHAARVTPLSCGNTVGSNRVDRPKREPGDRYEHASFRRSIARAVAAVNRTRKANREEPLRNFCPYECRHAAATRIRQAATLDAVQAVLGHAKIDMSAHYAQLNDTLAEAVMSKLG